jgi:hypothetical protein
MRKAHVYDDVDGSVHETLGALEELLVLSWLVSFGGCAHVQHERVVLLRLVLLQLLRQAEYGHVVVLCSHDLSN